MGYPEGEGNLKEQSEHAIAKACNVDYFGGWHILFPFNKRKRNCIFLASIPDGIPRGNRQAHTHTHTQHTHVQAYLCFDCLMEFLNYFPFKTTSHLYLL